MTKPKKYFIDQFNRLGIPCMDKVQDLHELKGDYINLEYTAPGGQKIKFLDDSAIYYGAELCKKGTHRCYGLSAGDDFLLVCEYGDGGSDPEIILYKKL